MKINNKDLQRLYRKHISQLPHQVRKGCPPSKKIINFFSSRLSTKQKIKIVDHITKCPSCLQEFEFILQVVRYNFQISKEIKDIFAPEEYLTTIREISDKIIKDLKKRQKSITPNMFPRFKHSILFLGGSAILVISIIIFVFLRPSRFPIDNQQRGKIVSQIKLIKPIGITPRSRSLSFKWEKMKNSEYYVLELFDETLTRIWKSENITKNQYTLPEEIQKKLAEDVSCFWLVTVFSSHEKIAESSLQEFNLKNN